MNRAQDLNHREKFPLSHPQKRIWYMEKINPDQPFHNVGGTVRIKGEVNFNFLEQAINQFVKENEGFRHRLVESNGEVQQYVEEYQKLHLRFFDFSSQENSDEAFKNWVQEEATQPFQIYNHALFHFALFKINDHDSGYFVKAHHLIADGWSMNILTEQICNSYVKLLKGERLTVQDHEPYTYYLTQEQKYLKSRRFLKNKQFWNEKFETIPEIIREAGLECAEGIRKTYHLSSDQSERIKSFVANQESSEFAFFVALYLMYLNKLTGKDDIVIGLPLYNRSGKKEKNIVGMFTSTMPFRFQIDGEMSGQQLIKEVNSELIRCYYHQKYPYDLLAQDLKLQERENGQLLNTCINYYNTNLVNEVDGTPIENKEFYNGKQLYSLQLIIREWSSSNEMDLDFDYKIQDYTDEQIEQMYHCLLHLTNQLIANPDQELDQFTLLPDDEWNKLIYEFNVTDQDYPKEKTIYQLFEEQVAKTPEHIALCLDDKKLTYRELNERSNQLARFLLKRNLKKGSIVGLCTTHSLETIIGILGILKAGSAYLPIDPNYPPERIKYILKDASISTLLINSPVSNHTELSYFKGDIIQLDSTDIYTEDTSNLGALNGSSDLAYVIYTSGSTGLPKGTMIEHQGLVNYTCWAKQVYMGSSKNEVFPFYSSLAFDLTVTSIFTPLISGNQMRIYPEDEDEYVLYKIFREGKASIIKLTPSHLSLLKEIDLETCSIKKMIVGGEQLKVSLAKDIVDRFAGEITIYNEYGPTETVVGCMIHPYDVGKDTGIYVPIGVPVQNTNIYLLNKDLNPVPLGEVGEIYISGDGVARGYLNKPDLTQERFMEDPFRKKTPMYKTGDLARFIDGTKIEYLGRADDQVKIRGYRIELGEIEKSLLLYPSIKEAIVVDQEDQNGSPYLCAYYTGKDTISSSELRSFLAKNLPAYMIPTHFFQLHRIPLTINGKVDRGQLPAPEMIRNDIHVDEVRNNKEEVLLQVTRDLLNVKVNLEDNFYHLGGDSIKAIQLSSNLVNQGFKIRVKDILAHPVIKDMTLYVEEVSRGSSENNRPCEGTIKSLPSTSWFFSRNLPNVHHYTQSLLLNLKKDVDISLIETALYMLVSHHDSFRLNYNDKTDTLYFNAENLTKKVEMETFDLSDVSASEQQSQIAKMGEMLKSSFDIRNDVLIKACLFHLRDHSFKLLLTAHHLAVDGVSWRIILEDLNHIYEQLHKSENVSLLPKTNSIQDWAHELEQFSQRIDEKDRQYWKHVYEHRMESLNDFDLGTDEMEHCESFVQTLTEEQTEQLLLKANDAYRTKPDELMIIALALLMKDYTQKDDIVIEVEGHGREEITEYIDVSRTVGWFTSLYPIQLTVQNVDLSMQIKLLKDQLRRIPNKGLCHGVLKYISGELPSNPQKLVRFNYLGDFNTTFSNGIFEFAEEYSGQEMSDQNEMDCLLDLVAYSVNQKLKITISYSRNKFKRETIEQFAHAYIKQLQSLINHCCDKEITEFTPTDFETTNLSMEDLDQIFND
ncbi:non-ribosomal peptide synthetase [Hazenella coriacea]|uniref:Non-ribosomal peptide synthase protein (TIGR01720 family)/amino acid adenylation domain-containing protein n=1 Tax=Hazenella coriacea TaxID=1179467 RepID=A0A4R3LAW8_9BACL|nr:non-ribosomal peptide synthetase [Hazenella coriacea]TCS97013.1 non-ribosomal peptide synthase protein (TIGR01720 family)/amino acid adenylation domain-containing protein [Hazenella coriacea]